MASRRTKKPALKKVESIEVDETPDSNDAEFDITALIALKAKRMVQQKTANQKLKKEVADAIEEVRVESVTKFRSGLDDISKAYDQFCLEQAAIQDEIRALWSQLAGIHFEFMNQSSEHLEKVKALEDIKAERFLESLATLKRACEDHEAIIADLGQLTE